jgi:hypothetical protein
MRRLLRVLAGSLLVALSPMAAAQADGDPIDTQVTKLDTTAAQRGPGLVATKIAASFTHLAGSRENALALVTALHDGTPATLAGANPLTYTPPTGKMGWGDVKISLALVQDSFAREGIARPTAEQLAARLNATLRMRAAGMGWGRIAKTNGTKAGPVVTDLKISTSKVGALPPARGDGKGD